jgi:hypothetical protein
MRHPVSSFLIPPFLPPFLPPPSFRSAFQSSPTDAAAHCCIRPPRRVRAAAGIDLALRCCCRSPRRAGRRTRSARAFGSPRICRRRPAAAGAEIERVGAEPSSAARLMASIAASVTQRRSASARPSRNSTLAPPVAKPRQSGPRSSHPVTVRRRHRYGRPTCCHAGLRAARIGADHRAKDEVG